MNLKFERVDNLIEQHTSDHINLDKAIAINDSSLNGKFRKLSLIMLRFLIRVSLLY